MLVCVILGRAEIPISGELIDKMNLRESLFELTNETLTFLEDEDRWKTIHPKWDLELLAYLYNIKDYAILEKRKNLLRKALELLMDNLSNEKDRFSIFGFLYDSTTIDTEENRNIPITIVEKIVTNKSNLIDTYLNEHSRYNLYSFYISANYYYLQLYDKSLDAVEEALKIYPNEKYGLLNKGAALSELGKNEEAIKCFEVITKLDPKYVLAWLNKGNAFINLDKNEEAIKCYDEIITKLDPKYVKAWYNKGIVLGRLGQHEEAIKCYDEIITKLDPKDVDAWYNKGWILDKLSRYQEAIECYDKALEIDSNNKDVMDSKGYTLINLDRYKEAIEYFNKALSIDPNYVDALEHRKIAEEKLQNRKI
jgi:tetratricopeptide (TPR) repeat protein